MILPKVSSKGCSPGNSPPRSRRPPPRSDEDSTGVQPSGGLLVQLRQHKRLNPVGTVSAKCDMASSTPLMPLFVVLPGCTPVQKRVLAYGDSLTAGFHAGSPWVPYGESLSKALARTGVNADVVVCGFPGRTAAWMAENTGSKLGLEEVLCTHGPFDLALLMAGTNDLSTRCAEDIFSSLQHLHEVCNSRGVPSVALAIPHSLATSRTGNHRDRRQTTNALLAAEAELRVGMTFVDTEDIVPWGAGDPRWDEDGLHLAPEGSRALGEGLSPYVAPVFAPDAD